MTLYKYGPDQTGNSLIRLGTVTSNVDGLAKFDLVSASVDVHTVNFELVGTKNDQVVAWSFSLSPGQHPIVTVKAQRVPVSIATIDCSRTVTYFDGSSSAGTHWTDVAELHNTSKMHGSAQLETGYSVTVDSVVSYDFGQTWNPAGNLSETASNSTTVTTNDQTFADVGKTFDSEVPYVDDYYHSIPADGTTTQHCQDWIKRHASGGPNGSFSGSTTYGSDWIYGKDGMSYLSAYNLPSTQRQVFDGGFTVQKTSGNGVKNGWRFDAAVLGLSGNIGVNVQYATKVTYTCYLQSPVDGSKAAHYIAYANSSSEFGQVFYWTNSDH